ncbi:MAG: exonuclease SbcCD subunit D [Negativicutes bacterium]
MKIAHIADIHWGLGYPGPTPQSRFEDICRVMDWSANRMIAEQVDLVLVAGDMFRKADVSLEKASREIRAAVVWLRKLTAAGIEVIVISGTPSHDPVSAYELLKAFELPNVYIYTEPTIAVLKNPVIVCLPGMDRSNFSTQDEFRGLPAHVAHQMMTNHITSITQKARRQINGPAILMGHLTYDLADTGFEDVLMQNEAILTQEAIQGYDLVCLGHIHRPQQNGAVFYSGSPERLSFSDEKQGAGFWIHEWDGISFANTDSRFINTPARKYLTINLNNNDIAEFNNGLAPFLHECHLLPGAIVRVIYSCDEAQNKQLDRRAMEQCLYDAGAFFVAEIRGEIARADRMRDADITDQLDPIAAVRKWAANQEISAAEIDELAALTGQLMEVA